MDGKYLKIITLKRTSQKLNSIANSSFALYFLAFFLPFFILGLVYLKHGMYPLGDKTVLICDLSGQYVDFFATYYEILTQGQSLLYSWQAGLGLNFLGLFAYYLASPFSLLIVLFPKENLTEALFLITLLKIAAAGLTFAIYANNTFGHSLAASPSPSAQAPAADEPKPNPVSHLDSKWNSESKLLLLIFSVLYALMAYSVSYSFNLMWLDGVILLPLVLLGVEKILRDNKYLLFLLSLIVIFLANYYISYMVGLFSFLYFLAAFFSRQPFTRQSLRLFARKFFLFSFSAVLAAGCAAVLLIPTFLALKNGQGGPNLSTAFDWQINFPLLDLLTKTQPGSYDTLQNKGTPNIYCGILPLLLLPLYYCQKNIPRGEKLIYSALLVFLIISFDFSNLDVIWHAFDRPDWFPHRYSFVFSFLLLFLALRSLQHLNKADLPRLYRSCFLWLALVVIIQKINSPLLSAKMLMISILFYGIYSLLLAGWLTVSQPRRKLFLLCLSALIMVETSLNTWYLLGKMNGEFQYVTKQDYERTLSKLEPFIPELQTKDPSFYRMERIGGRTFNDPMNLYYPGVAHFSSAANTEAHWALRQLGFLTTASYKSINFAGSTAVTESLLGIKYVLSAGEKGLGYQEIMDKGEFKAYRNNYALPLAFLTHRDLLIYDPTKDDNPFTLQNTLLNLAHGYSEENKFQAYFRPLTLKDTKLDNAFLSLEQGKEVIGRVNTSQEASVEYTLVCPEEGQAYACFQTITNEVKIYVNDQEIKGYLPLYNKRIVDLGYQRQGAELHVRLTFRNQGFTLAKKYFYYLCEDALARAILPLRNNPLENIRVEGTSVQGKVTVTGEGKDLLFTSILYDPGWQAFIDGQKAPTRKIGRAFLGVEVPPGEHEILLKFAPKGLTVGMVITGISVGMLLFLVFLLFSKKLKVKHKKIILS
ncbi:MAG TPA: YfhO family protein [Peptococcaceae bacterium]|nr:YfhO family protein [Peptococcaceae bacterium]